MEFIFQFSMCFIKISESVYAQRETTYIFLSLQCSKIHSNRWTMIVDRTHAAYIYLYRVRTKGWSRNKLNKQKLTLYPVQDSTRIRSNYTRFYSPTFKLYTILLAYVQTIQYFTRIRYNYTRFYSHTFKLYNILLAYVQTIHFS